MLGLSSGDVVFCKALPYLLGGVHVVLDATHHAPVLPETIITISLSFSAFKNPTSAGETLSFLQSFNVPHTKFHDIFILVWVCKNRCAFEQGGFFLQNLP